MNHRIALPLLLPVLLLALVAAAPAPACADAVVAAPAPPADVAPAPYHAAADGAAPVGGRDYFFCAAFQVIKYAGMITGRPEAVLAGAIGSGVACAYGW